MEEYSDTTIVESTVDNDANYVGATVADVVTTTRQTVDTNTTILLSQEQQQQYHRRHRFIAVRAGNGSLHGPAIFFSWQDAKKFVRGGGSQSEVDLSNNDVDDGNAGYSAFDTVQEAVMYLEQIKHDGNDHPHSSRLDPSNDVPSIGFTNTDISLDVGEDNNTSNIPCLETIPADTATQRYYVSGGKRPAPQMAIQTDEANNNNRSSSCGSKKVRRNDGDDIEGTNKISSKTLPLGETGGGDGPHVVNTTVFQQGITELEVNWDYVLQLMWDFRREFGHGDIPGRSNNSSTGSTATNATTDPSNVSGCNLSGGGGNPLGRFVTMIRRYHKQWQEWKQQQQHKRGGKSSSPQRPKHRLLVSFFTDERVRQLDDLGFVYVTKRGVKPIHITPEQEVKNFNTKLKELRRIVLELKDPIRKHPKMQEWITKQRAEYKIFQSGMLSNTTMTADRIVALAQAGFVFEATKKRTWDERAVEWLEYKSKNGGKDPRRYDESGLGKWVYDQRDKYRQMKENGKKTNLTEGQISRLTEWDFNWDYKPKSKENRVEKAPWDQRYRELVQYKEKYGTTLVPQGHPILGQWVHSQRNHYRLLVNGKKSPMTDNRLEKLKRIDFCFETVRGGAATVARRKAAIRHVGNSTQQQPHHQHHHHHPTQQQQEEQGESSESADNDDGMDDYNGDHDNEDHPNENETIHGEAVLNNNNNNNSGNTNDISQRMGRQDFPHLQHAVLDWERNRNNGN